MTPQTKDDAINQRLDEWKQAISAEMRELLDKASTLKQAANESKTVTSKKYYDKKFQKVAVEIRRLVAVLDRITEKDEDEK